MSLPRAIAVDGPAGSGKSSVSYIIAHDLDYLFIDTGAFYRALTLAALENGQVDASEEILADLGKRIEIGITAEVDTDGRQYTVLLGGRDVTWAIREHRVESHVSRIAAMRSVRDLINAQQRAIAQQNKVIMAGRDIGTVVLPDADLKLYLDASPEARGRRRYDQLIAAGKPANLDEITQDLRARDAYDSSRLIDPLRQAADAVYVNTDNLTIPEVVARIKQIIHDWGVAPTP
jgi:cytidylate kinase